MSVTFVRAASQGRISAGTQHAEQYLPSQGWHYAASQGWHYTASQGWH